MKIAFFQIVARRTDLNSWVSYESGWSYLISTGLFNALTCQHADIIYIPSDSCSVREQIQSCDIVILNDFNHAFANLGEVCTLDLETLIEIRRSKKLFGIINESVFHADSESPRQPIDLVREKLLRQSIALLDGVITVDYYDFIYFRIIGVNVMYSPFASPYLGGLIPRVMLNSRPIFLGSIYPYRKRFLEMNSLCNKILVTNLALDLVAGHKCCTEINRAVGNADNTSYFKSFDEFKFRQFRKYISALGGGGVVINLPSIFRGIACRMVECVQLNSYVICELPRTDFEVSLCSQFSNVIFYKAEIIGDLADKINYALTGPSPIASKLENSIFDIRVRAKQIIDFITIN